MFFNVKRLIQLAFFGRETFTLTNGTDTATANVFNAGQVYTPAGNDRINSLQDEDSLTGTGTNPTLNVTLGNPGDNGAATITPTLSGVQTVNAVFSSSNSSMNLDMQDATGTQNVNITRITTAQTATVQQMESATANLSVSDSVAFATVNLGYRSADVSTANLTIGNVNATEIAVGTGAGWNASLETLNLTSGTATKTNDNIVNQLDSTGNTTLGITANNANLTITDFTATANTLITVTGSKNVTLGNVGAAAAGFQLQGATQTGNLTANITNAADDATARIESGLGNDTITATTGLASDVFTNAGTDTVTITGNMTKDASITTGDDVDTVSVSGDMQGEPGTTTTSGAQVSTGAGDDVISVGAVTTGLVVAMATVTTNRASGDMGEEAGIDAGAGNDTVTLTGTTAGDTAGVTLDATGSTIVLGDGNDHLTFDLTNEGAVGTLVSGTIDGGANDVGSVDQMTVKGNASVTQVIDVAGGSIAAVTGVETLNLTSSQSIDEEKAAAINAVKDIGMNARINDADDDNNGGDTNTGEAAFANGQIDGTNSQTASYTVDVSKFTGLSTINLRHEDGVMLNRADESTPYVAFTGSRATHTLNNMTGTEALTISAEEADVTGADAAADTLGTVYAQGAFTADLTVNLDLVAGAEVAGNTASISLADPTGLDSIDSANNKNYDLSLNADNTANVFDSVSLTVAGTGNHGIDLNNDFATGLTVTGAGTGALTFANVNAATINTTGYAGNVYLDVESAVAHTISTGAGNDIIRLDGADDAAGALVTDNVNAGAGNDIVVFNGTGTRAGLTIADTVAGGDGSDTLAFGGEAIAISLGASEWTNVSGFETFKFSVGQANPTSYSIILNDSMVTANGANANMVTIVNDNDTVNDTAGALDTTGGGFTDNSVEAESAMTIDARTLAANKNFTYNGEEGTSRTADRFILADANVNAANIIDGGAVATGANVASAINTTVNWDVAEYVANADVLEVRNSAVVTASDLNNVRNVGTIVFNNDLAISQSITLELTDTVVDAMVNSYHTASSTEVETLNVRANDAAIASVASALINLDATALTNKSNLNITLDTTKTGVDTILSGDGADTITGASTGDTVNGGDGADILVFTLNSYDDTADGDIVAVETLQINGDGNISVDLASQTEAFTITITDTNGGDTLTSGSGADTITGSAGADSINGGAGADVITGGAGADTIDGGDGDDVIVIATATDSVGVAESYTGGNNTDTLRVTGTTALDLSDDTIATIETLDLTTDTGIQTITLTDAQRTGFTTVNANATDVLNITSLVNAVAGTAAIDKFIFAGGETNVAISSFTVGTDVINVNALTTAVATTAAFGQAFTTTNGAFYFLATGVAGDADSAGAVAIAMNGTATIIDANAIAYIVITDDNSSAIYKWTDTTASGDEVNAGELTLVGSVDAVITAGSLAFA